MTSTDQPISPLRRRFIEDMTARKLGAKTQVQYIRAVKRLAEFLGRSPASASAEDLRRFQLHLAESGDAERHADGAALLLRGHPGARRAPAEDPARLRAAPPAGGAEP